jgi:SM-20-related protein
MTGPAVTCAIVDGFLPEDVAARLLDDIVAAAPLFTQSRVGRPDNGAEVPGIRSSRRLPGRVGVELAPFRAAIAAQSARLCAAIGVQPFPVYHTECSVVAHGDGDYYRTHIDTSPTRGGPQPKHFRVVSCVYYLNREPKGFSGGALQVHALGLGDRRPAKVVIEPLHNRLAVFPAFIPHEVRTIDCPSGRFEDSRFSINCWLHRQRVNMKPPQS